MSIASPSSKAKMERKLAAIPCAAVFGCSRLIAR
jgi:hypothetical protein